MDGLRPTFEDAFRADYSGVVRVISPIVGSVADAEAVAQDAFLKAFTRWERSDATVRVHLHRARSALAASLESDPEEMTDGR